MNITGPIKQLIVDASTALGSRIHPAIVPENEALPYAAITVVSGFGSETKTGVSETDIIRVQIDCYGRTYGEAAAASQEVRDAIDYHSGTVTSGTDTVNVDWIVWAGPIEGFENAPRYFLVGSEYMVHIKN